MKIYKKIINGLLIVAFIISCISNYNIQNVAATSDKKVFSKPIKKFKKELRKDINWKDGFLHGKYYFEQIYVNGKLKKVLFAEKFCKAFQETDIYNKSGQNLTKKLFLKKASDMGYVYSMSKDKKTIIFSSCGLFSYMPIISFDVYKYIGGRYRLAKSYHYDNNKEWSKIDKILTKKYPKAMKGKKIKYYYYDGPANEAYY